jgi:hypothetical protein
VVIVLGLAAVLGGGLIAWLALKPLRPVTVILRNESEKSIAEARLEHERGVETVENIANGDARTIRFAGGENSYTLRVRFADGSEIAGNPQYADSGYEIVEAVTASGIRTDGLLPSKY